MTDTKISTSRPDGQYWVRFGAAHDWEVMRWDGSHFWGTAGDGYRGEDFEVGPQVFPPASRHQEPVNAPAAPSSPTVGGELEVFTQPVPFHWNTAEGTEVANRYLAMGRDDLTMADKSDLELANDVFMVMRHDLALSAYQTAAKERIRWLSAQLAAAQSSIQRAEKERDEAWASREWHRVSLEAQTENLREAEAQLAEVRKVLEPFLKVLDRDISANDADDDLFYVMTSGRNKAPRLRVGHFRALSAFLASLGEKPDAE